MDGRSAFLLSCLTVVAVTHATVTAQDDTGQSDDDPVPLLFEAYNTGDEYWFFIGDNDIKNPTLALRPGQQVAVTLDNKGSLGHNLRFGQPVDEALPVLDPANRQTLRFTVPDNATGETQYWCEPHRHLGMIGSVTFADETGPQGIKLPMVHPLVPLALFAAAVAWTRRAGA